MVRLNFVLVTMVLLTALAVVKTRDEARRLLGDSFKLKKQEDSLVAQRESLLLDRRSASNNMQVEKIAREKMDMSYVRPNITHYYYRDQKTAVDVQTGQAEKTTVISKPAPARSAKTVAAHEPVVKTTSAQQQKGKP